MFYKFFKYFLVFLCLSACCENESNQYEQTIDEHWTFKNVEDVGWLPATVPGSVHTDLITNKIIEDPFYRINEDTLQWIDKKDWEYRKTFTIPNNILEKEHVQLHFEGLDTYANIYLNDSLVLKANNMFLGWQVPCKPLLKEGVNVLRIVLESPIKIGLKKRERLGYELPNAVNDQSEKGGVGKKQVAVFSRKPGYHFGWDWGPRLVTSGIWKQVKVVAWDTAKLTDVFIHQKKLDETEASLIAEIEIKASKDFQADIEILIDSTRKINKEITLKKGVNNLEIPITIHSPELWWTNGLGNQKLYTIETIIKENNTIIDAVSKRVGLRTIEVIQKKDDLGKSFYFELNGAPVFMKGANYIPQDVFLNRVSKADYERIIKAAVESNFNMIRVWGGGIYEKDIFYDLCDAYGILVWQDFMFACAMYPGNDAFLDNVKKEAEYNVKRLRQHPSIALWCGDNEILTAWNNWGWIDQVTKSQGEAVKNRIWKAYEDVFHDILPNTVNKYDRDRLYWSSSPSSGFGTLDSLTAGDYHYWKVWSNKEPFSKYNEVIPRFMSEYGFQSFPEFESVKKYTEEQDWDIYSEVMKSHQRSSVGNENIEYYMLQNYKKPKDFESFLYVGQLLQAKGITTAIEAHRRNMPYCMGSLYWQFNDCWPAASWSSMDYYGNWKALQYGVKEAFKPTSVIPFQKGDSLEVYVVSDELKNQNAILSLKALDFNGKVLFNEEKVISIKSNSSTLYFSEDISNIVKKKLLKKSLIHIELIGEENTEIDDNVFYFTEPKDLKLTNPNVSFNCIKKDDTTFEITMNSNILAKNVCLRSDVKGRFSQNFKDILPAKNYKILFYSEGKDITIDAFKNSLKIMSLFDSF
ncbi:glycoside hydrolase family 2 protein [Flavivirga amylovorans]|uniref:Beta-mannosidase B n=1 Tax=Flavivirga amylovorans TaxID=870486 RepID=A0ABT8X387_9FLAO|nr:glycoside hydrolase family 2 protein [Flavivirga amylovorans]MDO5988408.1 glycoside hydrolase family 2 protein [Flavivirga amylovorans]